MCFEVLGDQGQHLLIPCHRLFQVTPIFLGVLVSFQQGPFEQDVGQLVEHDIVLGEVQLATGILIARIDDAREFGDGGVEVLLVGGVLGVDQAVEPGQGPPLVGQRPGRVEHPGGVIQLAQGEVDTGQVDIAMPFGFVAEGQQMLEGLLGLNQLAVLGRDAPLEQTADAIVVPALPGRWIGAVCSGTGWAAPSTGN